MVITGNNLQALIDQYHLAPKHSFDTFSITLVLDSKIIEFKDDIPYITYGQEITDEMLETKDISDGFILKPGQAILACSKEKIIMPKGFLGLLQTKGSLARLFVTIHCCDSQIESGFSGKITFEICNLGNINIKINAGQPVAQLFIFKTSSTEANYNGLYNNNDQPTLSKRNYNK